MKLLLDANLSPRLVDILDFEPFTVVHVFSVRDLHRDDLDIWEHARANDLTIVSKDSNFNALSLLRGAPPRVIWLRIGNGSTDQVAEIIQRHRAAIIDFHSDPAAALLVIGTKISSGTALP